jgi:hypothetical protein
LVGFVVFLGGLISWRTRCGAGESCRGGLGLVYSLLVLTVWCGLVFSRGLFFLLPHSVLVLHKQTMSQQIIDELELRLRQLDEQHIWLNQMIEEINEITTPQSVVNVRRRPFDPPTPSTMSLYESDFEEEDFPDTQSDMGDDLETVVYHTDRWGFYPRGVDNGGYNDSGEWDDDTETVVGDWEDPFMSPESLWAS